MSEIDLIPDDYRKQLRLRSLAGRLLVVGCAVVLMLAGARAGLALGIHRQSRELEALKAAQALALEQQGRLGELRVRKDALRRQLEILSGLRGGIAARRMLMALDGALEGRVWLLDWTFRRAGTLVDEKPETTHAGYLLVVPMADEKQPERAWLMQTHMELRGQAFDHSSLAAFVRRLVERPEIQEVRVLNTQARDYTESQVVQFELAVVVRSRA